MKDESKLIVPQEIGEIKLQNIVDMGLTFAAMIRLFNKETKRKLVKRLITTVKEAFEAKSEEEFRRIHSEFCQWGTREIILRKKNRPASYGQVAKTLDVVLKVAIYYCHLPECEKSAQLSRWLNAAVDTKIMGMLGKHYRGDIVPWPMRIESVDRQGYINIQDLVRRFIGTKHEDSITPVQFDDYYWYKLNREATYED